LQITDLTRKADAIDLGISPRGTLALFRSAQAMALIEGRDYCIADDIKRLVIPCFAHRLIVNSRAGALRQRTREAEQVLEGILQNVASPYNQLPG
jgi:MoxR-like ATPase